MTKTIARPKIDRRRAILDAALDLFTAKGLNGTSVEDIRAKTGASIGSIYHHFGSKEGVGRALYAEAIESYQRELSALLLEKPTAEDGIKAMVRHFLSWSAEHPKLAQLMLAAEHAELRNLATADVRDLNRRLMVEIARWFGEHVKELPGLTKVPSDVILCVVLGSAHRFGQMWISGKIKTPIDKAAGPLAEAAWAGLVAIAGAKR
jgi:AcrR family transcriptional regulator